MKSRSTWIFLGALVVALTQGAGSLRAQSTSAPAVAGGDDRPWNRGVARAAREAARDLFLEGNRLFRIPLFAQAAEKYVAALGRWKHPAFYFNLALAQLNLGQELEAHGNLERALQHGPEPIGVEEFKEAQKQLRDIERQLGRIRITCQARGAEVSLDSATLFVGPGSREAWVKATAHEVTTRSSAYLSEARRVTVGPGQLTTVDLQLITLDEATDASRRWTVWKPWAVFAVGAAATATGGVFHALSSRNFSSFDSDFQKQPCAQMAQPACPARTPEAPAPADLYRRLDAANRERTIALTGYVAGGSLLATGVVLLLLNRSRVSEQDAAHAQARSVAVLPTLSHDSAGVLLHVDY